MRLQNKLTGTFSLIIKAAATYLLVSFTSISALGAIYTSDTLKIMTEKWSDSIPVLMNSQQVEGLAIALVDRSGILWSGCFGYTDSSHIRPVDDATLFSVQSMSKNFTAMALLKAAGQGILDLDKPVSAYLPDFTVNSRYESSPEDKMTLRMLLSHRAGFTHEAPVGNNYYNEGSFEDHINSIPYTWLRFPVGRRYSYSNLGIDLAGHILATVTGQSFDNWIKENILEPSGMPHSSFDVAETELKGNRAKGYSSPGTEAPFYFAMKPSGGLYADITDLSNYLMLHLNNGINGDMQVIPGNLLNEMYTITDPLPHQVSGYGLGLSIRNDYDITLLTHGGSGFGFCSNILWSPEYGIGVVMLTNAAYISFQNSLPLALLFGAIKELYGRELQEDFLPSIYDREEIRIDTMVLQRLAGTYLYNRNGIMILEYYNHHLGIRPEGPEFYPAIFTSEHEFNFGPGPYPTFFSIYQASDSMPACLIRQFDGEYLDRNFGPCDPPGPDNPEWRQYAGKYSYFSQGRKSSNRIPVEVKNGYLCIYDYRLTEHLPGLFFTAHGEALDFRGEHPTWRNIKLEKED
jgi:CubicO group peptidase (beta-lactamase class C family)